MKEIEHEFGRLYVARDFNAISKMYTEDCQMFFDATEKPLCGRKGVLESLAFLHNRGVHKVTLHEDELIYGGGETAVQIGRFTAFDSHGGKKEEGKFQILYKKIGGQWFIHTDMSNGNCLDVAGQLCERFRKWNCMFQGGDANAMAAEFYTDDCKIAMPGKPMLCGKREVANALKEVMGAAGHKNGRAQQKQGEVICIADDCAVEVNSTFKMHDANGQVTDTGRYMAVWKKVGGKWMVHADIMNHIQDSGHGRHHDSHHY